MRLMSVEMPYWADVVVPISQRLENIIALHMDTVTGKIASGVTHEPFRCLS